MSFSKSTYTCNACNSKDVDALKFQLVHHDTFYTGQNQQDNAECLLVLIDLKGSMPDSSSTTYPTGASLSAILFSFALEKYIVCDVCGLRSPSFEFSSVLYITPTDTSSMQDLIIQGLQQKLQKSCSRCNENTGHIESSYILQPPKYLLFFVYRFRYINHNVTKDRCSIIMNTTVILHSSITNGNNILNGWPLKLWWGYVIKGPMSSLWKLDIR